MHAPNATDAKMKGPSVLLGQKGKPRKVSWKSEHLSWVLQDEYKFAMVRIRKNVLKGVWKGCLLAQTVKCLPLARIMITESWD